MSPSLHSHPGVRKLHAGGIGSWLASICWLSRNRRADSFPPSALPEFHATPATVKALGREGFWLDEGSGIHVPQWVHSRYSGHAIQLWKFGPLEDVRHKIPRALRHAVYERDGYVCRHCGTSEQLSLDHIHPFSLGGTDAIDNLQTLCRPCNSRKGARV